MSHMSHIRGHATPEIDGSDPADAAQRSPEKPGPAPNCRQKNVGVPPIRAPHRAAMDFLDSLAFLDFLARLNARAFANLDVNEHVIDLQGWKCKSFDAQFAQHVHAVAARRRISSEQPLIIVEVGTWKGLSSASMAVACRNRGVPARIVTVDTWLGSPEFWTCTQDDRERVLNVIDGWPSVFYTFTRNMKKLGLHNMVCPLPISSMQGAAVLTHFGVVADIVYVDASHEHDAVISDAAAYWALLRPGGVMFGDDYCDIWPGVVSAVDQFARERGLTVHNDGVVWWVHKPVEPIEPGKPAKPVEPAEPAEPVGLAKPVEPGKPETSTSGTTQVTYVA